MASKRLGRLLLALVAVWSFAGLDWHRDESTPLTQLLLSPTPAYAGDPDEVAGSPDDGSGDTPPPPPAPTSGKQDQQPKKNLWGVILHAVESLLGG